MPTILNEVEVRVLGSLVEKQVTTPEYYPLTLNALTLASNQKNNRNPVTSHSEATIMQALESLREKNLAYVFYGSNNRVPKYKHVMPEVLHLSPQELALLCVLMLRGPLTIGELKDRAARLYEFAGLDETEQTLSALSTREDEPLVVRLPRQPGQKEARYAHLLSGEIDSEALAAVESSPRPSRRGTDSETVKRLDEEVATLRAEVEALKQQFQSFKKQFE